MLFTKLRSSEDPVVFFCNFSTVWCGRLLKIAVTNVHRDCDVATNVHRDCDVATNVQRDCDVATNVQRDCDVATNVQRDSCELTVIYCRFNKTRILSKYFRKILKYQTLITLSSGSRVAPYRQTDMTELIVAFILAILPTRISKRFRWIFRLNELRTTLELG
jgi:hypothetical protein